MGIGVRHTEGGFCFVCFVSTQQGRDGKGGHSATSVVCVCVCLHACVQEREREREGGGEISSREGAGVYSCRHLQKRAHNMCAHDTDMHTQIHAQTHNMCMHAHTHADHRDKHKLRHVHVGKHKLD